jgi:arylsulfatase
LVIRQNKKIRLESGKTWPVTPQTLSPGEHKIFVYDGGGMGKGANIILKVDGKEIAQKRIERTIAIRFSLDETFDIGEDTGTPVDFSVYDVPFKFNGELKKVSVNLKP